MKPADHPRKRHPRKRPSRKRQPRKRPSTLGWALIAVLFVPGIAGAQDQESCHDTAPATEAHDPHQAHRAHQAVPQAAPQAGVSNQPRALALPHVELVDQDGHSVDLYDDLIADRVVAMNFIFTTCTTVCPPMGASFGKLQKELGDLLGSEVGLVSVSIDPTTDTPPRLKSWGAKFGAREEWSLLTGAKQDVDLVLRALEVFTPSPDDHGPIVLLGNDRTNTWLRVNGLTPPAKLAQMLKEMVNDGKPAIEKEAR